MTQRTIELFPTQMRFVTSAERFTGFIGGIGSGKTFAGCVKDLMHARPKTLGLIVAPTYPMLRDATLRTFLEIADSSVRHFNKSEMTAYLKGGAEILFRSADNPERLRGPNLNWAHIDEGAMCSAKTYDIVIGRLRADGKAGPMWITSTPKGRNWLYQRHAEMVVFRAKTRDNPYLAREFVVSLEKSYSGEFARQELDGEFISLEGLVYDAFKRDIHVAERPHNQFVDWVLAMDEGYTNPAVILLIGVDPDGRLHIAREYYERGKLQADVVNIARAWYLEKRCTVAAVDAAAAGLIADLVNAGVPAEPHKGRVLDGITSIQRHLKVQGDGRPRLTIDPSCINTINEFESYVWQDGKDQPVKQSDHAMDALRYLIVSRADVGSLVLF